MNRFSRWVSGLLFFSAAALCGCGAESESKGSGSDAGNGADAGEPGSAGSSGSGIGGNAGGAGAGGVGGSAGSAGTAKGAGGSSGNGGSGGGDEPLVPLITGHRSTFRFVAINSAMPLQETCVDPFAEVGATDTIQATTGVRYLSFCTSTTVLLVGSGDSLVAYPIDPATGTTLGAPIEYIHSPVVEGESWDVSGDTMTWAEVTDPVTVPAGTFQNCWERVAPVDITTFVYCRGAGLVSGVSTTRNWRIELVSKNF